MMVSKAEAKTRRDRKQAELEAAESDAECRSLALYLSKYEEEVKLRVEPPPAPYGKPLDELFRDKLAAGGCDPWTPRFRSVVDPGPEDTSMVAVALTSMGGGSEGPVGLGGRSRPSALPAMTLSQFSRESARRGSASANPELTSVHQSLTSVRSSLAPEHEPEALEVTSVQLDLTSVQSDPTSEQGDLISEQPGPTSVRGNLTSVRPRSTSARGVVISAHVSLASAQAETAGDAAGAAKTDECAVVSGGAAAAPVPRKRKALESLAPQDMGAERLKARRTGKFSVKWKGRNWEFGFTSMLHRKKCIVLPDLQPSDGDVKIALTASVESGPAARVQDGEGDTVYSYHHSSAQVVGTYALIPLSLFVKLAEHFGGAAVQGPRVAQCAAQCCRKLFDPK